MINKLKELLNASMIFIGVIGVLSIIMYFGITILIGLIPIILVLIGISAVISYFHRDEIKKLHDEMNEKLKKVAKEIKSETEVNRENESPEDTQTEKSE